LFLRALDLPPVERKAFLEQACAGDAALLDRVRALLQAHEDATGPFQDRAAMNPGPNAGEGRPILAGRYKLSQRLGEGGMGEVWHAEQLEPVKRFVAVKLIKQGMDTRQVLARFEAERQALALMDHPNIAKVLDAGST